MDIRVIGVIGLGTMGAGIAEVFARAGFEVVAAEADQAALARGIATVNESLARAVRRGKLTGTEQAEIASLIRPAARLADLAPADLVIEVVPERLAIKRQIVAELDDICRADTIIATNTSSLSVTSVAAASAVPGRVIGMHFFNPAPVMRLVEVVSTVLTSPAVVQAVSALARRAGKTPVQVTDRAGFVANALLLPYLNHAAALLESGYATRDDIDTAATEGIGLPMGPLALLDLIGLDTSLAVLDVLRQEFGGTRRTPAPLLRRLTEAGRLGRKSGAGFYDYPDGRPAAAGAPAVREEDAPAAPATVLLIDPAAGQAAALADRIAGAGIVLTRDAAQDADLVVVAIDARGGVLGPAMAAGRAADAVGLHLAGQALAEIVPSPLTSPRALAAASSLTERLGVRAVRAPDRPGLLVGALLYPHLRDAVQMVADGYATPADVDAAMTLGCGYPRGPISLLTAAGLASACEVLSAMHAAWGDPAFAPPPMLTQYAQAGLSLAGDAHPGT